MLNDCAKRFVDGGISKHTAPDKTFKTALSRIENMERPILTRFFPVEAPSGIPQYAFVGTEEFRTHVPYGILTNGKGHTRSQAMASGIMEMVERFSCYKYSSPGNHNIAKVCAFKDLYDNPFQAGDVFSFVHQKTFERTIHDREMENSNMAFYPGYSLTGEETYLPLTLLRYFTGTNGMAAGNTLEEALLQAVCEVIERYCLSMIRLERRTAPTIQISSIDNPIACELMERLQRNAERLTIMDFSIGLGIPVIGVIRELDDEHCMLTAGVAADPGEALVRALTENSQVEHKMHYDRVSQLSHVFDHNGRVSWDQIPRLASRNIKTELLRLDEILSAQDMKTYFIDTTDKELAIPSVTVFITGTIYFVPHESRKAFALEPLILERLAVKDYRGAKKYVDMGKSEHTSRLAYYRYYQGVLYWMKGDYAQALKSYDSSLGETLEPKTRAHCLAQAALCCHMTGNMKKTLDYFLKLNQVDPSFCLEWLQTHPAMISAKARKSFIISYGLYNELLMIKASAEKNGKKLQPALKAYLKDRKKISGAFQKASAHFNAGLYIKAIEEAEKAIALNPYTSLIYNIPHFLGLCYIGLGDWAGAIRELEEAVEATIGDRGLLSLVAECRRMAAETDRNTIIQQGGKTTIILKDVVEQAMVSETELASTRARIKKLGFQ
jgi:ribosomal protein S12 methylthiotransferase accessory factor